MAKLNKTSIALAMGAAFAVSVGTTSIASAANTAENPFAMNDLSSGYMVAEAEKAKEGKCGEGKCGGDMKKDGKAKEGKCGEGKCGGDMKKDGKAKEGKCGEGKCGGDKK